MNLLSQFEQLFNSQEKAIARIVGERGGGLLVGETLGGGTVLLKGKLEIGKLCFYDRISNEILGEAPNVEFKEYSV